MSFNPCAECKAPMACRDRNLCGIKENEDAVARRSRRERSYRESLYPKCGCGNTLSKATQEAGGTLCPACEGVAEERKDAEFLRNLRLSTEAKEQS